MKTMGFLGWTTDRAVENVHEERKNTVWGHRAGQRVGGSDGFPWGCAGLIKPQNAPVSECRCVRQQASVSGPGPGSTVLMASPRSPRARGRRGVWIESPGQKARGPGTSLWRWWQGEGSGKGRRKVLKSPAALIMSPRTPQGC